MASLTQAVQNPCKKGINNQSHFPHPEQQNKFIQCSSWGQMFIFTCPENTIWNQEKLTCARGPSTGARVLETTTTTTTTTTRSTTTTAPIKTTAFAAISGVVPNQPISVQNVAVQTVPPVILPSQSNLQIAAQNLLRENQQLIQQQQQLNELIEKQRVVEQQQFRTSNNQAESIVQPAQQTLEVINTAQQDSAPVLAPVQQPVQT